MLQDYYEKNNLEMKPYEYYLAEFQNVNPEGVTSRLDIPFDDNSKSFIIKFMQNTYTISYDIAVKSGNVYLGFADRFTGTLIITGEISDVISALTEIVDYFRDTLGYVVCNITKR